MSEQKIISPLLDGFTMGNPMSEHDGVRCCPAIKENTDKKYIVKIISVPASQVQMDALLLAGAYKDPADAMDYFKDRAEDVVKEAELLQKLSRLDGFLPYEGWQIAPITRHRLGYEVYLLGTYKRSLAKHLRRNPVTHLEAVNLGLDLCSALSMCRQAGAMYVDLKPSNIFMSDKKEYRIGDLGFIRLDALSYSTLPEKYRSVYTPPEFSDPMAPLNTTADTYSLGMILYQLYNDGQLPSASTDPEAQPPSPVNADYEIAEIIMKAIHPDPEQRWRDPAQMGQALVSYMQRNSVNDIPITPHTPLEPAPVSIPADVKAASTESPAAEPPEEDASTQEIPADVTESNDAAVAAEEIPAASLAAAEAEADDSAPCEEDAQDLLPHEMSEELSRIVAKADDLIAHETPVGVVIPEAPELADPFAFAEEDSEEIDDSDIPVDPVMEEDEKDPPKEKKKKKTKRFVSPEHKRRVKRFFSSLLWLLVAAALGFCGFLYYQHFYLQSIDGLTIVGTEQALTVSIDSQIDDSLLSVVCSDNYGNVRTEPVAGGKASFTELLPNTLYSIQVEISGFHKLQGHTADVFTTDANTSIVSFTAVTGPEDGSAVINFTVDGDEPDEWTVICTAEGEEEHRQTFTGHSATIKGLSVGKVYTFTIGTADDLTLNGMTSIEFMASRLILAQNLHVTSSNGSDMTIRWNAPGDVIIDSWDVRCYSDNGYEQRFTVDEPTAILPGIDSSASYTIEVTASGMTQPARTNITKNPINITQINTVNAEDPTAEALEISWQYTGDAPEDGWLVMYTIGGSTTPNVVKCEKASASIAPWVPEVKYQITIQAADGTSVFSNVHTLVSPAAEPFEKHSLSADKLTAKLLKTPEKKDWLYENISDSDFTDQFAPGDSISVVLRSSATFYLPGAQTRILYVVRDAHGNAIPDLISEKTIVWKKIWSGGDAKAGELNVPKVPVSTGEYVLDIYFDGMSVAHLPFSVAE